MIDVGRMHLDKTKRTIVISDIHANLKLFKELLGKLNYTKEDYLFINGDLCEKGPNSLEVVKYVRDLSERFQNVYVTKGNCDLLYRYVFNGSEGIIPYMNKQPNSVLNEMLTIHSKTLDDFSNLTELTHFYREHFHDEIEWIESLPTAYETDDFIVIHAGIENIEDWYQTEERFALYTDSFYEKEHQADKTVIVGHWPVVNYRAKQISSHNPLIDLDKKIIALDGGNQIKKDGQLNALIIINDTFSYTYVDELTEEMIVQIDYSDLANRMGTVTYPNYELRILKREEYFTLCENMKLGIDQWIKNEYLVDNDDLTNCRTDLSTTFLSVNRDEKVWIVDKDCEGYILIKRANGEVGWIPKNCLNV
ncbi:metallophosphoesterase [Psychrobacillus sp. NPDC058041]|uniref:metallophosphoesterase n=1 Tax=Psychrobacillus sp. NPDC058041 TaxID=3346310 RepID=UPI0036DEE6CC